MTRTMKLLSRSAIGTALVVGLWLTLVQPASAEIFPIAFAAHQQTPHFEVLLAEEALSKSAKRDCAQCAILA